jgi:hypothetical protein
MPEMEGERLILDEMLVEAAGVEPSSVLTAGKLLISMNCHKG